MSGNAREMTKSNFILIASRFVLKTNRRCPKRTEVSLSLPNDATTSASAFLRTRSFAARCRHAYAE